ncbi:hypothetical protein tinsulaeT_34440 [Thalassotalea insulae]|uniref:Ig-like domain-containing protein n=1 Tax=Thalassotalea insulae TaxID=2056778 RepID=A0ABQ6GXR2_9GAMM|nr:hypothetical protein [Thalassotalea insulae]GLX80104.1 hypothetical protein tinsulaeT_34440 [Thalassotalea insulae]
MNNRLAIFSLSLLLIACNGSSGSTVTPTTPINTSEPIDTNIVQPDKEIYIGQSTELILLAPDEKISDIQWQQTSGEPLTFYADTSKAIGFTPLVAGDYSFTVSYKNENAQPQQLSYQFSVAQNQALLTARLGHAVIEGNGVSLISYPVTTDNGITIDPASLNWRQTEGPAVTYTDNDTQGKVAVFFDAPAVDKDTLLQFTVSGEANGESYSDNIAILVENSDIPVASSNDSPFSDRKAKVFLYNASSPAGQTLIDCVYSNKASYDNSCTLSQTPLIAHISESPTIDDIMDRVIVSHQWMGDQFKQFLQSYDNQHHDFKNLLRATTAIVISYDIRPSFYHPYTGAIYLDPSDLWETPEQRDTINQAPDYRAAFGSELQFEMPWRYVKNNEYANYYAPISYRLSRSLSSALYDMASLLYHELAHANDFFPSTSWHSISKTKSLLKIVNERFYQQQIQSDNLQQVYPLDPLYPDDANELTQLAQVRFHGETASEQQQAYTPDDIANMFKTEGAPQFYSYSSTREDYAILFDGFMMQVRYNVLRDVAVSDQAYQQIFWGQRGRIGESWIKPRVEFVSSRILPELTLVSDYVNALAPPQALDISKDWSGSLVIEQPNEIKPNTLAEHLLKQSKPQDPRLVPQDGIDRHQQNRRFIYK